jgi:hypothetical protein
MVEGVAGREVADGGEHGQVGEATGGRRGARLEHGAESVTSGGDLLDCGAHHIGADHGGGGLAQSAGLHLLGEVGDATVSTQTSTVMRLPQSFAVFSAVPSGAASRPARGMLAASRRMRSE